MLSERSLLWAYAFYLLLNIFKKSSESRGRFCEGETYICSAGPCKYENSVKNHWYVHAFAEAFESSMFPPCTPYKTY